MDNYSIFSNVTLMPDTESEKPKSFFFLFFFYQILPNITVTLYVLKDKISTQK